jgi:glycolate oxidase FAD binding subunit
MRDGGAAGRIRHALGTVAGGDALLAEAEAARYAVHGETPAAVVAPADGAGVAAVLALATAEGWVVEAAGHGRRLDWGRPPERLDVVVSTRRLAAVSEYEPADLTAGVGAGATLGDLARTLGEHRQTLALDPPGWRAATLGAVVAGAGAGPLRLTQGNHRDHVLGIELATGDGRLLRLGGRVVKNVAGYDLVKLVVGSRGTLGVITAAHVRLKPVPDADLSAVIAGRHAGDPGWCLDRLMAARVQPAAAELVSRAVAGRIGLNTPGWALFVRFMGNEAAAADAVERLGPALHSRESGRLTPPAAEAVWDGLAQMETAAAAVVRLADLPTRLEATIAAAEQLAGTADPLLAAHAGEGIVRVLVEQPDTGLADRVAEARGVLEGSGGSVIVAWGPAALMRAVDPWGDPGPQRRLMRELKAKFDPAGIMAPGRFVL